MPRKVSYGNDYDEGYDHYDDYEYDYDFEGGWSFHPWVVQTVPKFLVVD